MCRLLDIQLISIDKLKEAYYNPFLQAMMKKKHKTRWKWKYNNGVRPNGKDMLRNGI